MTLLKTVPLKTRGDLASRAVFRALWLTVGYLLGCLFFRFLGGDDFPHRYVLPILGFVLFFGLLSDGFRLKNARGARAPKTNFK
ncbi:hypothetical protein [Coraliomargarita sinensis]|uniref:hypothetical protein n=1 Tax=Coraliomargarita sinensis TaxID=2174842 RepID=UPI0011B4CD78|nr:hypothetical protein [Coraliomargarita sinensis]